LPAAPGMPSDAVTKDAPPVSSPAPAVRSRIPPPVPRRPRPLPALVAAAIIVALFAGLLLRFAQGRFWDVLQQPTATAFFAQAPTATAGVRPGFLPVTGRWSVSSLSTTSTIVVSMSVANVLYRDGKLLQRSDDGGKTWRTISTPQIPGVPAAATEGAVGIM